MQATRLSIEHAMINNTRGLQTLNVLSHFHTTLPFHWLHFWHSLWKVVCHSVHRRHWHQRFPRVLGFTISRNMFCSHNNAKHQIATSMTPISKDVNQLFCSSALKQKFITHCEELEHNFQTGHQPLKISGLWNQGAKKILTGHYAGITSYIL